MNIGIVTTWFERGAAYVSRQFMDLLEKTDNVFVYARGGESYAIGNPKWDLNNVYWSKRDIGRSAILGGVSMDKNEFISWLKRNRIEIVLFNEQQWFQPILWCNELGIKTAAYVDYYTEQTIPLFDLYDTVICNTKRHAFAFRNHHHVNYIKWGTDLNLYQPSKEKHEQVTFFHSAGMAPIRKGTDLVIRAFHNMDDRHLSKLIIHTQVDLIKACPDIKEVLTALENEGSVEVVTGTISAPGLYYRGDVYVYPSRLDGIGLTLMEAIASGMACITCNNAPMNEFVEPEFGDLCLVDYYYSRVDGYYWPMCVTSIDSLSSAMHKYIDGSRDLEIMKLKARQYAERELNFQKNCTELRRILESTRAHNISDSLRERAYNYDYNGIKAYYKLLAPLYSIYAKIKK